MNQNHKQLWDYAINIGMKVGHDLRQKLNIDEDNFRFRAPYSHINSRNVYIYRAIDEVQKAATCLIRWKEFISDENENNLKKDVEKQVMRITQQAVFDEQSLRCRKLIESLVDTILFLTTNEDIYFKDYFYFYDLIGCQNSQNDRNEFYDFINRNTENQIQWFEKKIFALETSGLDHNKRWYLKESCSLSSMKNIFLASFRSKYKKISIDQGPEIITLLAKSYLHAYGESRDIHFSADETSHSFNDNALILKADKVAILLINLILKLQELSLFEIDKKNDVLSGIRKKVEDAIPYKELTSSQAKIGDYVLAWGDLGQVIQERKSKYGYFCYHVRYIEKPPIEGIVDDWFASFEIRRLGSKKQLLRRVKSILSKYSDHEIDDNTLEKINDKMFEQYLSQCIREMIG